MGLLIGYKVVAPSLIPGVFVPSVQNQSSIKYEVGKKTQRDPRSEGPLAVFTSLYYAETFAEREEIILRVTYKRSKARNLWQLRTPDDVNIRTQKRIRLNLLDCPLGTVFAEWVMPEAIVMKR